MSAPLIFISTHPVKAGALGGVRQFLLDLFEVLEVNQPRALAVNAYLNRDGTEVAIVQFHPDLASIKEYWKVVHQHTGRELAEFLDAPTSTQIYGDLGDTPLERTRHSPDAGLGVAVMAEHVGGFTRLA